MAKVYVASSWRNAYQPEVVRRLREAGHAVYDFRNPVENPGGFHWADVDPGWQEWSPREYIEHLDHPVARKGFQADLNAMLWAEAPTPRPAGSPAAVCGQSSIFLKNRSRN